MAYSEREGLKAILKSWFVCLPQTKLARIMFRLQGSVEQSSTLQCTILIGKTEPLVFSFLRLGQEITAARLQLQAIPTDFHFQPMVSAVGLHIAE